MPDRDRQTILVIRLGAMGDILHALPAAASLKLSFPDKKLVWITKPKWAALLEGNPFIDEITLFDRSNAGSLAKCWHQIRAIRPLIALDFQGLVQSAVIGRAAGPQTFWGFDSKTAREPLAALFYTDRTAPPGPHRVERNLQLVQTAGAKVTTTESWIPAGAPEGQLPAAPFILASPFAGWSGKQWPMDAYIELGRLLASQGLDLVLNVSAEQEAALGPVFPLRTHVSSIAGLIDATRRASAVVGVDSGPLHLAAALRKPGVGIFGPTDPAANGPFGGSMTVLRSSDATTSYERRTQVAPSMTAISVDSVLEALLHSLHTNAGAPCSR
jgi:heptosyltransferase-1